MDKTKKIYKIAYMGILFATSLVFSFLESLIPFDGILPPGAKLGLSNIITMYSLFFLGVPSAFLVAVLKSFFVFLMRGSTAFFLSFAGGVISVLVMSVLFYVFKIKSYYILSIFGAVFHNIGQLLASTIVLMNIKVLFYFPILLISGIIMGVITALVLKNILPFVKKISKINIS
jgi:heptaprenyl diphosphate synthase